MLSISNQICSHTLTRLLLILLILTTCLVGLFYQCHFFCVAVFVYNFFAKKKLNLVELVLIVIAISVVIVAIIFCSIDSANASASDLNSIFISYIELFYEYLSILVVLFASKLLVTITNKKGTNKGIENIN